MTNTRIRYFCSECSKQFSSELWAYRHNGEKKKKGHYIEVWEFGKDENGKPKGREVR